MTTEATQTPPETPNPRPRFLARVSVTRTFATEVLCDANNQDEAFADLEAWAKGANVLSPDWGILADTRVRIEMKPAPAVPAKAE
jgi:hypothetical protein